MNIKDATTSFLLARQRRVTITLFVFFVSALPVFFAPMVFTEHDWYATINWPDNTPNAKIWLFAYLVFHLLFAFQVSDEYELNGNHNAFYVWIVQVVALCFLMWATFSLHNFYVVAAFDLLTGATGIALLFVSQNRAIGSFVRTIPFSLYYGYATYFAVQTALLN